MCRLVTAGVVLATVLLTAVLGATDGRASPPSAEAWPAVPVHW